MSLPSPTIRSAYQARLVAGDLKPDPAQDEAIDVLQKFADDLKNHGPASHGGLFGKIFGGHTLKHGSGGLYIYGKVGRGKSMLMDLFIEHVEIIKKRRVHFHQFMLEIHARLNVLRQGNNVPDIMARLVQDLADETTLLCFDEFHVSNIADAMILGRLFEGLFNAGTTIVSTSNWAPDDLYKNGLQRDRFLPFIATIKNRMTIFEMDGRTDYRYEQLRYLKSYFCPLGLETTRKLQGIFIDLTHDAALVPLTLHVNGRELNIAQTTQGIGFFNFEELCTAALGSADYLAIAGCLHTVIIDNVPALRSEQRNEAIRFMTLIDTLYEAKVKLFMASAVPIERLATAEDISTAFMRTISRLMEMQSDAYRSKPHMAGTTEDEDG